MQFSFILVDTVTKGNIGAAARAIKTMGFHDLRLVRTCDHLSNDSVWMAHGSVDVLESAKTYMTLKEAVSDLDFVIGTSARKRDINKVYHSIHEITGILRSREATATSVGIVFGKEATGLTNEELSLCDVLSTIPMANPYPTVNLSQAVMLYAFVLSTFSISGLHLKQKQPLKYSDMEFHALKQKVKSILSTIGLDEKNRSHKRITDKLASLKPEDLRLIFDACNRAEKYLKN